MVLLIMTIFRNASMGFNKVIFMLNEIKMQLEKMLVFLKLASCKKGSSAFFKAIWIENAGYTSFQVLSVLIFILSWMSSKQFIDSTGPWTTFLVELSHSYSASTAAVGRGTAWLSSCPKSWRILGNQNTELIGTSYWGSMTQTIYPNPKVLLEMYTWKYNSIYA